MSFLTTIDAHAGGQPFRLVTSGLPQPRGTTMWQKREWLSRHADRLRRAIVREPRGHVDLVAGVLTEPVSPGAHAGLLFMSGDGYPASSGHGVIAAVTIAIEHALITLPPTNLAEVTLVFDTPAGAVSAVARVEDRGGARRVDSVVFTNVPAFVQEAARPVRVGGRELRVDLAFGGMYYALLDTEAVGVPLDAARLPELRRLARDILASLGTGPRIEHPFHSELTGVAGVVFTGPPRDPEAHLRNITVTGSVVDRSPSGGGTSAVMAVLDAMGLLPDDQPFVNEGLAGALFRGRAARRTAVGDFAAVVPEIEASAWVTGEHRFVLADDDPFREGVEY